MATAMATATAKRSDPPPLAEIGIPESELVLGETCYEFYVDEEKLEERILRLFCTNSEINFQKN